MKRDGMPAMQLRSLLLLITSIPLKGKMYFHLPMAELNRERILQGSAFDMNVFTMTRE